MAPWDAFTDRADDDVLLLAFGYLRAGHVLTLAASSASASVRLAGLKQPASVIQKEAAERPTVALRFAAAHLSGPVGIASAVTAAAAAVAVARPYRLGGRKAAAFGTHTCTTTDSEGDVREKFDFRKASGGPLAALRAFASATPAAEALRLAVVLAGAPSNPASDGASATSAGDLGPSAGPFMDAFFRSEVQRFSDHWTSVVSENCSADAAAGFGRSRKRASLGAAAAAAAPTAVADAALTMLIHFREVGTNIARLIAEAIRASERNLDRLVDEGRIDGSSYEPIARQRSAAEFFRQRLDCSGVTAHMGAAHELESALVSWDETVIGYIKEGYVFTCPRLVNGVTRCAVPYAHWWMFIGQSHAQGWAVLR